MKKLQLTIAMLMLMLPFYAQQLPESNLHLLNRYSINPAYAGFNGCMEAYVSNLSQWGGFDGAPKTSYFSIHSALPELNENMSIGGQMVMDRTDMINRFSAVVSYGYKLDLGNEHFLRFGLAAGMYQVNADPTSATVLESGDAIVLAGVNKGITFSSEFGALYHWKNVQFGVSIPELFQRKIDFNIQGLGSEYYLNRSLQIFGSYKFEINDEFTVEPAFLFKTIGTGIGQLDFTALGTYKDMVSLGLGYRTNSGLLAQFHYKIKDMISLGYSYAVPGSGIIQYTSGSHEIMLGIKLCKEKTQNSSF
jgi:type IX secretion system PorP/SprF family membrane protein